MKKNKLQVMGNVGKLDLSGQLNSNINCDSECMDPDPNWPTSVGNEKSEEPADYERAITACGYGKFNYLLFLGLIPMCAAQLFSSGTVSFVLPTADCDLQLTDFQKGALNAGTYAGNIMSGLVWGAISDIVGRRKLMMGAFLLDGVLSLMCAFSHAFWVLLLLKILSGAIITGPNAVLYAYLAEITGDKHRAQTIMWNGMFFALAQVIQPVLAYMIIPLNFRLSLVDGILDMTSWRLFMIVCALPSVISGLLFLCFPESPKFLMSKNRTEEALEIFRKIYAMNTGNPMHMYPITRLVDVGGLEKTVEDTSKSSTKKAIREGWKQLSPIFRKPHLSVLLLLVIIQFFIMICINSIRLWTPQLFAQLDMYDKLGANAPPASSVCDMISATQYSVSNPDEGSRPVRDCAPVDGEVYLRSVVIGSVATLSYLITGFIIKRVGKRPIAMACFPMSALCSLALIWATDADIFMALIAGYTSLVGNGLTAVSAVAIDLFPTSLRGLSVSIIMTCGRVASLTGNLILPVLLNLSCQAVFYFVFGCLTVCSILSFAIPSRKTES